MAESPQSDPGARRAAIADELRRVEESAMYSAQTQFETAKHWRGVHLLMGIPTTLLAAVAGTTALVESTGRVAAGILALVSAGLGAVMTTVNAPQRMSHATACANAYLEVQTAARQTRTVDLPVLALDDARAVLAELTSRCGEQNRAAEPPGRRAYRRAQSNIEGGGQTYAVDRADAHPVPASRDGA
ncbi:SLATT domain-containing protein [Streptomyces seoulensis]|uniref:SLATT domain-containing protein n=1 Tax=Streptomyces seoulensis TaxID=73044 RepID=A0A4P6U4Z4_STRSO|nr:SLATT domain-containing protein [Streptomyces seoulensis]QBJ93228.1 SLATT domain-containing protein [Streptomyces seoulensis]